MTDEKILEQDEIVLMVGIDGAPFANSSALQAWPIMGYIENSNVPVFDIGLYVGTKKPNSACDFLADYATEKIQLDATGVLVGPNKILRKFRIKCICADAPARAFISGTRYFNHLKG